MSFVNLEKSQLFCQLRFFCFGWKWGGGSTPKSCHVFTYLHFPCTLHIRIGTYVNESTYLHRCQFLYVVYLVTLTHYIKDPNGLFPNIDFSFLFFSNATSFVQRIMNNDANSPQRRWFKPITIAKGDGLDLALMCLVGVKS